MRRSSSETSASPVDLHRAAAPLLIAALVAAAALGLLAHFRQSAAVGTCTINWTGAAGDSLWTTAGNWDLSRVPGTADYACIPAGSTQTVTISSGGQTVQGVDSQGAALALSGGTLELTDPAQSSSIRNLSFAGGTITVRSGVSLALAGGSSWSDGNLTGPGTTTIASGATLTLAGGTPTLQGGHTLANQGTATWVSGNVCLAEGAVFNNAGTFNVQTDGSIFICVAGAGPRLHNLSGAALTRSGPAGQTALINAVPFDNDGTLQANSASLAVDASSSGGAADSGLISIASGASVELRGGNRAFSAPASESGAGTLLLTGATLSGNLQINGTASWSSGEMTGLGTTTIASGATLTLAGGTPTLQGGHTLANQGTATWVSGNVCLAEGAVFNNAGTFNVQTDGSIFICVAGAAPRLHNLSGATLTRSGPAGQIALINAVPFDNDGTLRIASAILRLLGNYVQPAGATLEVIISGPVPGVGFGQFQVSETATLGGNLVLTSGGGFTPTPGQTFRVMTCETACTGTFASVSINYDALYNPTDVTVVALPTVTALQPPTGPEGGGTTVIITGTGFTGATAVAFGATPATSFTVDLDTQITAVSPPGTGTVDVTVTAGGVTSRTSPADQFTYVPAAAPQSSGSMARSERLRYF